MTCTGRPVVMSRCTHTSDKNYNLQRELAHSPLHSQESSAWSKPTSPSSDLVSIILAPSL